MKPMNGWRGLLALLALTGAGVVLPQAAGAATVATATCEATGEPGSILSLCNLTTMALGETILVASFTSGFDGSAVVRLTDLLAPAALSTLSFQITTAKGEILGYSATAGALEFAALAGVQYFAQVYLLPQTDFGLAHLGVELTPIPLPAGALLLASGLALLGRGARRSSRQRREDR